MPNLTLDLRYLRCALCASEHGSFRRAASILELPQSTISRRIQLLEHQLGFPLFVRSRRGATLTMAGSAFLKDALPCAREIAQAAETAANVQKGETGGLTIGMLASLTPGHIQDILYRFREDFPRIRVALREGQHEGMLHDLATGSLDAAFVTGFSEVPNLETKQLWTESVFAVVPWAHRLTRSEPLHWDDMRQELFLVTNGGSGGEIHDYIIRKVSQLGFRPRVDVHDVSRESLLTLVAMNYGVTLSRTSSMRKSFPGIAYLPITGEQDTVPASIVWSAENENPALRRFLSLAENVTSDVAAMAHLESIDC